MHDTTHEKLEVNERVPTAAPGNKAGLMMAVLVFVVGSMFAFAFLNAEFFVMVCEKAGIISTSPDKLRGDAVVGAEIGRPIEVYFSARVSEDLPITLTVDNKYQKSFVNKAQINDYRFVNQSDRTIYFKPVHDVFPSAAGKPEALILTKCFCFDLQKIEPHQSYTLPVEYTFTDEIGDGTRVIRMSYSLFPTTREEYETWIANNGGDPADGTANYAGEKAP